MSFLVRQALRIFQPYEDLCISLGECTRKRSSVEPHRVLVGRTSARRRLRGKRRISALVVPMAEPSKSSFHPVNPDIAGHAWRIAPQLPCADLLTRN
jgi:hypothetical protein